MTRKLLTLIAFAASALPAIAAEDADTNGDGVLSVEEVQAVWPEVTVEMFISMDTDGDGLLNDEEVAAAREYGNLPTAG